ncbi:helicase-exonuclease AddAB subunit AddB [Paenibacillus cymbidii]|uniref:helicase-exonuclease AddAB subunit AddB n=1 Tax=Paenibacillus cymbidii TaxID=1639034 RepID=UPI001081980B|nr:helicase-exonuclease AddAB subunit AddB [Paenibacillus cymbidii]
MAIRFVLGRAGSGKSAAVLGEIRQRLQQSPDGHPLVLLVPEQATFQAELALVSTPGLAGLLRAQVLSFRRLAWRVMQETGDTAGVPVDETGKALLLQRILHERRDELRVFRGTSEKIGFTERLLSLFSELKRYCLSADLLEHHALRLEPEKGRQAAQLRDKLHDVTLVYRLFEERLAQQYLDGESYLTHLASRLADSAALDGAEVWIDGFHGFTPQEFAVLGALMNVSRSVTVALCLDREYAAGERPHELDLFHPPAMTMIRLLELAESLGAGPVSSIILGREGNRLPRFEASPMLAHLERNYAYRLSGRAEPYVSQPGAEDAGISLRAAANRRAETEGAAREMIRLVRDRGYRWRDMAVRVRNIEAYGELLSSVLNDYGIPYFFDQKRSVLHHPLAEFIRSAIEVVRFDWRYDAVFRCVKTDFLLPDDADAAIWLDVAASAKELDEDGRLTAFRHAMDELENVVLARGIHGWRWRDDRSWAMRRELTLEEAAAAANGDEAAEADAPPQRPWHDPAFERRIAACRQAIVGPLGRFQQRVENADNALALAEALYILLEECGVDGKLAALGERALHEGKPELAREHKQVWDSTIAMLDQLAQMMGEEPLPFELFGDLIEAGLSGIRLGLVPPALDQVLIGSIDRTRSAQVKIAFVLGVGDGVLPARINEDGVLTEQERETLLDEGVPLADSSRRKLLDEQFLIYTVLCAPSHRLWLSYPLADEEGKSLLPSELVGQLKRLFPQLREKLLLVEPPADLHEAEQIAYAAVPDRTLTYLTSRLKAWTEGRGMAAVWWEAYNWFAARPEWQARLSAMLRSLVYTNEEAPLSAQTSLQLYGERVKASVSRLERFAWCPFSQFVSHGLRLKERRIYRLEAPDIGQLFHAALSGFMREMQADRETWEGLDEGQIRSRADRLVDKLAPILQGEILLSSSRFRHIARKLQTIIGQTSLMLVEHARRGAFVPVGLELGFGPGETLPPLMLPLPNGRTLEMVGRIDRIDRADGADGALLRIIDYKSSPTALRLAELYHGLSLQMVTYLDVVLTHARRWLGEAARPAGVLYFHVHNPLIQSANALAPEQAASELRKRFKMRGLLLADRQTIELMDGGLQATSGHSQLLPVALKADGSFYKSASVATDEQWSQLRRHVRRTIRRIGTELTEGNVAIEPHRIGSRLPCTFCSYKPVCQFEPAFAGNHYRLLEERGKDETWRLFAEGEAADTGPGTGTKGGEGSDD